MNINNIFSTIDTHVLGEPFRIVILSPITFTSRDIKENNKILQENYTSVKHLLLNEPRGHRGMNGCFILPPNNSEYGLLFFNHNSATSFKYEGLAASLTALLETGNLLPNKSRKYKVETVDGYFLLEAKMENNQVKSIKMQVKDAKVINSSSVHSVVSIDDKRKYVIESIPESIGAINMNNLEMLMQLGGEKIRQYENEEADGIIIVENLGNNLFSTVTFEKDGYIRRTPGLDTTVAISLVFQSEISKDLPVKNKTIFSEELTVHKELNDDSVYTFTTRPFITGLQEFLFDEDDPLPNGFLLR